jgi:hypothetical protein
MRNVRRKLGFVTMDVWAAFVGLQILSKGIAKLEAFDHHPVIVVSLLSLGAFVLVASLLPLCLEKRLPHAHAIFHVAEGVAMSLSAMILFEKGKLRIPIVFLCAGLLYVVAGYLESRTRARRERLAGPMLKGVGVAITAGGVILATFTLLGDRDAWALGAAAFFVLVGVTLLLAAPLLLRRAAADASSNQSVRPAAETE